MAIKFHNGQRVKIIAHEGNPKFNGRTGVVVRLLISTNEAAWIRCDEPLPDDLRVFPAGDNREDYAKVYSDEVESV